MQSERFLIGLERDDMSEQKNTKIKSVLDFVDDDISSIFRDNPRIVAHEIPLKMQLIRNIRELTLAILAGINEYKRNKYENRTEG